jgi:serine/threonine-protein phosphatase 2A regulatory subunit A
MNRLCSNFISSENATAKLGDFDQVILALGEKMGDLLPYIGGPTHASAVIEILETLCGTEEITARTAAASSTNRVIAQLSKTHVDQVNDYFEMFKRMSNEEAGEVFYTRVSSCSIVAELYRVLSDDLRGSLREIYMRLVIDELPMVRRAAAQVFLNVAGQAEVEVVLDEYLQVMKSFATDEFQTVRVIGTENLLPFLRLLKKLGTPGAVAAASELLPLVKCACEDLSWRIRLAISKNFGDFAEMFTREEVMNEIFPLGIVLIQDNEPDVRTNSLKGMISFQAVVPQDIYIGDLMPVALSLVEDPFLSARKLLAELCIDIAAKAGPDAFSGTLSDVIMRLVVDEDPLVRLRILKKLPIIAAEIPNLCTVLTEHMKKMFVDPNWRIRKELALVMPHILKSMGQDHFCEQFLDHFLQLLNDDVGEVRLACAESLPKLATPSNATWVHETLFPAVRDLATGGCLIRLSMISALQGLMEAEISERFQSEVLALVISASKDQVSAG